MLMVRVIGSVTTMLTQFTTKSTWPSTTVSVVSCGGQLILTISRESTAERVRFVLSSSIPLYCLGRYPLVNASRRNWLNGLGPGATTDRPETSETTSSSSSPTASTSSTTKATMPPGGCIHGEYYPHPEDCRLYYHCSNNQLYEEECAIGTYWDTSNHFCDWEHRVDCCNGQRPCPSK